MESHYLLNAMQTWSRELAGQSQPWEAPRGLYGLDIMGEIHRGGGNIGIYWGSGEYDFEFRWEFDEKEEPNKGEFVIYNISDDTIRKIQVGDLLIVFGGFEGGWFFCASITEISAEWKGADKAVTLYLVESGMNANSVAFSTWYDQGRDAEIQALAPGGPNVSKTYAAGVRAAQILSDLVFWSGYPCLEVSPEQDRVYSEAVVLEGPLFSLLQEYAAACGATAYLANGLLVVKNLGVDRGRDRLLISQHTGLLEAPTPFAEEGGGENAPSYRGYTVKMLGSQRVQMGAPVRLQSRYVDAELKILRGKHNFDGLRFVSEATLIE